MKNYTTHNQVMTMQMNSYATPNIDTQVQVQINQLRSACEELIQNLVALDDKLHPILTPIVPVEANECIEEQAIVPLADILRVDVRMIRDAIGRVDSILHRCEL